MKRQFKQRLLLVGVFAIFFVPVITAIVLRANPSFIGGFHTTNRGQLLSEARKITLPVAKSVGVDAHEALRFQDKWTLLTLNQGTCESSCRQRLTALYTAHTATNKDINRVQRILLLPQGVENVEITRAFPALKVFQVNKAWAESMTDEKDPFGIGKTYVIDPRGFLFLLYSDPVKARDILQDLKRLLKISKLG